VSSQLVPEDANQPEWDVVCIKHLCNTQQLDGVLLSRVQDDHLQHTSGYLFPDDSDPFGFSGGRLFRSGTNQIVEVLADLPDDSGEGRSEQLLHVVRPRAIPVVGFQVVNPLKREREEEVFESSTLSPTADQCR